MLKDPIITTKEQDGIPIPVLYCLPQHTKTIKTALEESSSSSKNNDNGLGLFYKKYRIHKVTQSNHIEYMAVPLNLTDEAVSYKNDLNNANANSHQILSYLRCKLNLSADVIRGIGYETNCPLSSAGNAKATQQLAGSRESILLALKRSEFPSISFQNLFDKLPKRLEFLGDAPNSRTLVLPSTIVTTLNDLPASHIGLADKESSETFRRQLDTFYENLAEINQVKRIASKATIDAGSSIRESHCQILFHSDVLSHHNEKNGWVTVTEYHIPMSFDMTKVMYSRGNVTEKRRFGTKLVCSNDVVVDLYAGIGYYTLPALVQGKAKHVHACEWNPDAVKALRWNLHQNKVASKATIYEGDCRISAAKYLLGLADRVSLGLLPSSEGGWRVAVQVLNTVRGGWLHVHGNVPISERQDWIAWVTHFIWNICVDQKKNDWVAICTHDERVKSFAPKIDHVVADLFVGPRNCAKMELLHLLTEENYEGVLMLSLNIGIVNSLGKLEAIDPQAVKKPSCALDVNGPINQKWMR